MQLKRQFMVFPTPQLRDGGVLMIDKKICRIQKRLRTTNVEDTKVNLWADIQYCVGQELKCTRHLNTLLPHNGGGEEVYSQEYSEDNADKPGAVSKCMKNVLLEV